MAKRFVHGTKVWFFCFLLLVMPLAAQTNSWISPSGGYWEDGSSWSLGQPIGSAFLITNAGTKTVVIGTNAIAMNPAPDPYSPGVLRVGSIILSAPPGSTNHLLLNGEEGAVAFRVSNQTHIMENGVLESREATLLLHNFVQLEGTLIQKGGTLQISGAPTLNGRLLLENTTISNFYGGMRLDWRADVRQTGGSVSMSVLSSRGRFQLADGILKTGNMELGTWGWGGSFYQLSGSSTFAEVHLGGAPRSNGGGARCSISGGSFTADRISVGGTSSFGFSGSTLYVSNTIVVGGYVEYLGGPLNSGGFGFGGSSMYSKGINVSYGSFSQSNGSNHVDGVLSVNGEIVWGNGTRYGTVYSLSGGTLQVRRLEVGQGGVLRCEKSLGNNAIIVQEGFWLGGSFFTGGTSQQFHSIGCGESSLIDMGNSGTLWFSNSKHPGVSALRITNWSGALTGGGATRLIFGTNALALTAAQAASIRFANPKGLPPGTYRGRILATGEVVPDPCFLFHERSGSELVLTWFGEYKLQSAERPEGPYSDVLQTSPYRVPATRSREFFRVVSGSQP